MRKKFKTLTGGDRHVMVPLLLDVISTISQEIISTKFRKNET